MTEAETTKGDVTDILAEAIAAVAAANVPAELKEAAFSKAVDVIMAKRTAGSATTMGTGMPAPPAIAPVAHGASPPSGDLLGRIAGRLGLDRGVVSEVFDDGDGRIDVIVATRRLDPGKAPATKQLATLVAAGRQGADLEEWTDVGEIRRITDDYKRYDEGNFAATLKEMDDIFRIKQSGRKISVKLGRPGWDRASELVARLAREEE